MANAYEELQLPPKPAHFLYPRPLPPGVSKLPSVVPVGSKPAVSQPKYSAEPKPAVSQPKYSAVPSPGLLPTAIHRPPPPAVPQHPPAPLLKNASTTVSQPRFTFSQNTAPPCPAKMAHPRTQPPYVSSPPPPPVVPARSLTQPPALSSGVVGRGRAYLPLEVQQAQNKVSEKSVVEEESPPPATFTNEPTHHAPPPPPLPGHPNTAHLVPVPAKPKPAPPRPVPAPAPPHPVPAQPPQPVPAPVQPPQPVPAPLPPHHPAPSPPAQPPQPVPAKPAPLPPVHPAPSSSTPSSSTPSSSSSSSTAPSPSFINPSGGALLYVYNQSTSVSNANLQTMIAAINTQLISFSSAWQILTPFVQLVSPSVSYTSLPPSSYIFYVIDNATVNGALAYHTEESDRIDGYVFALTILQNGGVQLYKDRQTPTVASALSHEILEAIIDPTCNIWWDNENGVNWAGEVCDPVQDNIVPYTIQVFGSSVLVGLSDYVLPSWRDPEFTGGKVNCSGTLNRPFTMSPGGYAITFDYQTGSVNTVYGATVPAWQKEIKQSGFSRATKIRSKKAVRLPVASPKPSASAHSS